MKFFRIYRDENSDGGGGNFNPTGDASPAVESSTPSNDGGTSEAVTEGGSSGDVYPAEPGSNGSADPSSGESAPTDNYVLTKMPERGTSEYDQKFNELSMEDQLKLEQEINSMYNESDPELAKLLLGESDDATDDADKTTEVSGDKTDMTDENSQEFKSISQDVFNKLPPEVQTTVKAMNDTLKEAEPYLTDEFQAGFKAINEDPVIQNRLQELKNGNTGINQHIKEGYNPNDHITKEDVESLDFSTPEKKSASITKISEWLNNAADKGFKISSDNSNLEKGIYEQKINTKIEVEKQIGAMVSKNPSMQSDLGYEDNDHPLATFFTWVGENGIKGDAFAKFGVEHVFSMYQSQTGNTQKIIDKQVMETKKKIFLDLDNHDSNARNLSRNTQSHTDSTQGQMYKGIDTQRYLNDAAYASRMYEKADWPTQQKLESLKYTGTIE